VHPNVPAILHLDFGVGALDDQHLLDDAKTFDGVVGDRLERDAFAATEAFVCGDDDFRFRVDDPIAKRLGAEAAEHDRVYGADSSAGEHRVRELGDHGEVNANPVALANAKRPQRVGDTADRCF
jgi:hypothetical protein